MTEAERKGIEDALYVGAMRLTDLDFERKITPADRFRLPFVDMTLDRPLEAADRLMALHAGQQTTRPGAALGHALRLLDEPASVAVGLEIVDRGPEELPEPLRSEVARLAAELALANSEIRGALANVSPVDQRRLIESLPGWAAEEESIRFSFVRSAERLSQEQIVGLVSQIDLARISRAGQRVSDAVDRALPGLRRSAVQWTDARTYTIAGQKVVIAGTGSNVHTDVDARLTIDLGGDDLYRGRHGAGIGHANVLIDLAGNDRYETSDLNLGAGLLGVGLAYDGMGDDLYRTRSLSLGCGLVGVGLLVNVGGHDVYDSTSLSQGYGQFGAGMLIDSVGDDRYTVRLFGQGAARTRGVGWLIDRAGSDVYRAGGIVNAAPLLPTATYSFAQGYSSGYRELAGGLSGGVGLLTDFAGNDAYLGEVYAQASSYWYAVGSLYDAAGHDSYSAYYYSQASAMHVCSAYLFDLAGDDAFVVRLGAGHAIGHDYGVAFLLDREGTDVYAGRDSNPGVATANGLSLFVDGAGDDRYQGPPGRGNPARGTGSIAVFVDLGGQDLYRADLADGLALSRDTWGVAYDQEDPPRPRPETGPDRVVPVPGSRAMPPEAEMERLYRRASQWRVGNAVQDRDDAVDTLIAIGMPALEWMLEKKLRAATHLEARAFASVVAALGVPAREAIALRLLSEHDNEVRIALRIVEDVRIEEARATVPTVIAKGRHVNQAVRVAGILQAVQAVDEIMPLAASSNPISALAAAVALAQIGDESAFSTMEALLRDRRLPIRRAAIQLVAKFPARAETVALAMALEEDEGTVRTALEILGAIGTPAALKELGQRLLDARPGVRLTALQQISGRCPPEYRSFLIQLKQDPVPVVRAAAQRVDPGR